MTRPKGLTLIEVVAATLIVAMLAAAIGSAARVILQTDRAADETTRSGELGLGLLEEIAALPFDDPTSGETVLGPEAGEWNPPLDRSLFDDVDDYGVWDGTRPLQDKNGYAIDAPGFARRVIVAYVSGPDFDATSIEPTEYKRITVDVMLDGTTIASYRTVRAQGGRDVDFAG